MRLVVDHGMFDERRRMVQCNFYVLLLPAEHMGYVHGGSWFTTWVASESL